MKKINVGIVGMGYIGESHIEAVRRIGACQLLAVADTNEELARSKAEQYGIAKCYPSVEALVADPDIDAVHDCTPNCLHPHINRMVLEAGKHLLSEKPLATSFDQAEELVLLSRQHPELAVGVNFNYRINPLVQEMRARVQRGEIGQVRLATGSYQQDWLLYDTDYSWRLEPSVAGCSCAIADIGSHWMDAVMHITGHRITEVMADLVTVIPIRKKPRRQSETFTSVTPVEYDEVFIENEEYGAVLFKTDQGMSGTFHVSEVAAGHGCYFVIEINGSKETLRWNQEENDRLWVGRRDADNSLVIRNPNAISPQARPYTSLAMGHPEGWSDAFKGNIEAFYRYIQQGLKGERVFATVDQAAYIVKLTEAIARSAKERRWISVDEESSLT